MVGQQSNSASYSNVSESWFVAKAMKNSTYLLAAFQLFLILLYAICGGNEVIASGSGSRGAGILGTGTQAYNMFIGVEIMMFIGFGYLMTFMKWYGLGAVGFTMLVTAMGLQWAVFTESFMDQMVNASGPWHSVDLNMYSLLNALYAISAVLITFGALIGKITPFQVIVVTIVELIFHSFNYKVLMIKMMNLSDIGGTYIDHMFGAYFGLTVAWVLGKPKTVPVMGAISDYFSLIGTTFLWVYWPSFVAGATVADSAAQERAFVHTILSLAASTIATFFASSSILLPEKTRKFRPVDIQNATLAGGVAIGAVATLDIGCFCAVMIGTAAGLLSTVGYHRIQPYLEERFGLHDTCGIHNLHAMPSVVGAIASVMVASTLPNGYGSVTQPQWIAQLFAIPVCIGFAVLMGLIVGKFLNWLSPNSGEEHARAFHDAEWWEVAGDYDNDNENNYKSLELVKIKPTNTKKDDVVVRKDVETGALLDTGDFVYSHGITSQEAERLLAVHGPNELPDVKVPKWLIFLQQLWQPMPIMIWLAALIEAAIANYPDMGILLFIQFANASIGYYEITKAGDAVDALKNSLKPKATVKRDGKWIEINATYVVPGDLCLLASGGAIPADCRVNKGQIDVDQAALTGESLPVTFTASDKCCMGSTVVRGETEGTVEFTGQETFLGKTAALLQGPVEISNMQKMLIRIVFILVILSSILCTIVLIYVTTLTDFKEALSFVVVLMVASIPMAVEIVTTTTLALGSKELSAQGAIVSRLAAIEDLAGMTILCSDKTGTLTLNQMQIQEYTPIYSADETQYSLLRYAAMAAKWQEPPRDALDRLTLGCVDMPSMDCMEQLDYMPFDPIVKRTEGTVKDKNTGKQYKTTKGAPHVILHLVQDGPGRDDALAKKIESDVTELGGRGIRAIAVARTDDEGTWRMLGLLTFLDPPRPDTKSTIDNAKKYGVAVKMITGDHLLIARETARVLALGDCVSNAQGLPLLTKDKKKPENLSRDYGNICLAADGFAQVFPEHKFLIVECLRELGYKVGMTGDGVNDAPALKQADVGIAVDGATDAAKAAAHIVLTRPGLSTIVEGILIARRIWVRIRNFLTYRIAATLQLVSFFFVAVFAFEPQKYDSSYPKFFHMPVLMLMLITLLNDGTLITIGYDIAVPTMTPPKWNVPFLFSMAAVQAGVAMISSIILLSILLESNSPTSFLKQIGIGAISYGKVTTAIYLKVSVSDFLTLFSARAGGDWFWHVRPANILLAGAAIALTSSTLIAMFWPESRPDKILTEGLLDSKPYSLVVFVWFWSLIWWFLEDAAKVFCRWYVHKNNIFNINDSGVLVLPEAALRVQRQMRIDMKSEVVSAGHH